MIMFDSYRVKRRLRALIRDWMKYRDILRQFKDTPSLTPKEEGGYLELKARIAKQIPFLSEAVPRNLLQETQAHVGLMTELLNRKGSLQAESEMSEKERGAFEKGWQHVFIFLNKLEGVHLEVKETKRKVSRRGVPTGMPRGRRKPSAGVKLARFGARLVLLAFVLYLLAAGIGVDRNEEGRLVANLPNSFGEVTDNLWSGVTTLSDRGLHFMQPVINSYGIEVTVGLIGLLLLGLGYLIFIRSR
jgi:hypothetical protein